MKQFLIACAVATTAVLHPAFTEIGSSQSPSPVVTPSPGKVELAVPKAIIDWIYAFSIGGSAVAAVLAWIAQIRWSDQYKAAVEQIIKSKDSEIQALKTGIDALQLAQEETIRAKDIEILRLKEATPGALSEYVQKLKTLSNEAIKDKDQQILEKDQLIEELKKQHAQEQEIKRVEQDKEKIKIEREILRRQAALAQALKEKQLKLLEKILKAEEPRLIEQIKSLEDELQKNNTQ